MTAPSDELLPGTQRALLHRLATGQSEGRAPSMVGGVVREGAPVWTHGRGLVDGQPPTADTQYRIGSLTKTFVAVLVMRLRDEGRLSLCDPLDKHLAGTAAGRLTIAELLAHTSGLSAETPGPWWERTPGELRPALPDILGEEPMRHPQGRRFHYSNPGFALLGALVERLRVVRDAGGAVSHLDVGSFVFTREPYDASSAVPGGVDPDGWRAKSRS